MKSINDLQTMRIQTRTLQREEFGLWSNLTRCAYAVCQRGNPSPKGREMSQLSKSYVYALAPPDAEGALEYEKSEKTGPCYHASCPREPTLPSRMGVERART
jgi:hypothetical protein